MAAKTFADILKFNPYHDSLGRFSTADAAAHFTIRTRDPDKQYLANEGIRREQARDAAERQENGPQMKAIHDIEDQIRHQDMESSALVDKDGNVLFFKDGIENEVSFTKAECLMMKDNILTHNHPGSSMFSNEDVDLWAYWGLQGIRATTREGVTYSIERGEGYTPQKGDDFTLNFRFDYIKAKYSAQKIMSDKGIPWKLQKGEMTDEQASAEYRKTIASEFSKLCTEAAPKFGIKFTVETREVSKSAGTTVYKAKASDGGEIVAVLDRDTEEDITASFNEWLESVLKNPAGKSDTINTPEETHNTAKSIDDSTAVLFIGLQISGAESLAIKGGEDPEDFHVTLAYGHFDTHGHDEDDTSVRVQKAIDDIRDLIPDSIQFDATGRFDASESSDGKDVIYAQVAAGQLEKAHDGLLEALKKQGIELEGTFPEYKPHMTLAYIEPGAEFELKKLDTTGTAEKVMIGHGWESTHENNYTIKKMDEDKRLVFGWASVSIRADGEQLEDRQQDLIDPEDLEESAYEFVLNFRDTGELHNPNLRKKGKLVESCVFTEEKQRAMGIPEGLIPVGWWIGFKIEDDAAWEKVKNGTYKMFSIEGKAQRVPVEKAAPEVTAPVVSNDDPDRFDHIQEFDFP